jgi:hypothetical protein
MKKIHDFRTRTSDEIKNKKIKMHEYYRSDLTKIVKKQSNLDVNASFVTIFVLIHQRSSKRLMKVQGCSRTSCFTFYHFYENVQHAPTTTAPGSHDHLPQLVFPILGCEKTMRNFEIAQ